MNCPKGLFYFKNCITEELLSKMKTYLDSEEFKKISFHVNRSNPDSRVVAHFGFKYGYLSGDIKEKAVEFPEVIVELQKLIWEMCQKGELSEDCKFNQCIINRYLPGQGIGKHTDRMEYGDEIACFTIGGGAEMEFTRKDHDTYKVYTEDASMYLMTGDSRYLWKHQMRGRLRDPEHGDRETRWSLTFRTVSDSE